MIFIINTFSFVIENMKAKVYIETSIISYLAAKQSRDLIVAANQQITHEWWDNRRNLFDLFSSSLVIEEASKGDSDAANKRLAILNNINIIGLNPEIMKFAGMIINGRILPTKASDDAIHISVAIIYSFDYLLTWNCKHIANAEIQKQILKLANKFGYEMPVICTPYELLGE
ncbi:MAG: hypothetical protein HW421_190 [Ignavibacteria bacterium]|nr:hypothetical protein [Ignavibacteria bacterium]